MEEHGKSKNIDMRRLQIEYENNDFIDFGKHNEFWKNIFENVWKVHFFATIPSEQNSFLHLWALQWEKLTFYWSKFYLDKN